MKLRILHFLSVKFVLVFLLVSNSHCFLADSISKGSLFASTNTSISSDPETCEAINCEAGFFQTIDDDGKLVRYEYDGFSLGFTQISVFGFTVNATAFNIEDNYLYTCLLYTSPSPRDRG